MNTDATSDRCPKCGAAVPPDAAEGLCTRCLLQDAALPADLDQPTHPGSAPPSIERVAGAFPQLEIIELIGVGGMGAVYRARQPRLDRLVALKILPEALAHDPAFAERFQRDGRVLARLNHPNIVSVHDFGEAGGLFYLMMEYVDGVNLRQDDVRERPLEAASTSRSASTPAASSPTVLPADAGGRHRRALRTRRWLIGHLAAPVASGSDPGDLGRPARLV